MLGPSLNSKIFCIFLVTFAEKMRAAHLLIFCPLFYKKACLSSWGLMIINAMDGSCSITILPAIVTLDQPSALSGGLRIMSARGNQFRSPHPLAPTLSLESGPTGFEKRSPLGIVPRFGLPLTLPSPGHCNGPGGPGLPLDYSGRFAYTHVRARGGGQQTCALTRYPISRCLADRSLALGSLSIRTPNAMAPMAMHPKMTRKISEATCSTDFPSAFALACSLANASGVTSSPSFNSPPLSIVRKTSSSRSLDNFGGIDRPSSQLT